MSYAPLESGAVRALEVHIGGAQTGKLDLRYVLDADLSRVRIPPARTSRQTDELWKHTCFEAFIRGRDSGAYHELNFSPSTEWAIYSFESYRKGMAPVDVPQPPEIRVERSAHLLQVDVSIDLRTWSRSGALALAAVIEDENGRLSYWALKHPAGKPDFHHTDSFVLEL
jgi:hypothetical protein